VREEPLETMLGVAGTLPEPPPYAWPEEANARRLLHTVRNILLIETQLPPSAVHLLRNARELFVFLHDVANEKVYKKKNEYFIKRDGREYVVARDLESGLHAFSAVAEQVVLIQRDEKGNSLPDGSPWRVNPDEAVRAIRASAMGQRFAQEKAWTKWENLLRGLALEYGDDLPPKVVPG
jgi:hypothetical protein